MAFTGFKNFKRTLSIVVVLGTLSTPVFNATAQSLGESCMVSSDDTTKLQGLLNSQRQLLESLEPNTMSVDLARLMFVKKAVTDVQDSFRSNIIGGKAPVTFATMRLVQTLIIKYRHSTVFFGWEAEPSVNSIYTEETAGILTTLKNNYEEMVNVFGYDDSPYTTITANTFKEMKKDLDQVMQLPVDASLKAKLNALIPGLGKAIAIAEQGDRPCAFAEAAKVNSAIRALYPLFEQLATSRAGYSLIMELQGANEFYAEYSQADQVVSAGQCR